MFLVFLELEDLPELRWCLNEWLAGDESGHQVLLQLVQLKGGHLALGVEGVPGEGDQGRAGKRGLVLGGRLVAAANQLQEAVHTVQSAEEGGYYIWSRFNN